jgi:branched-chain amino acid transport system ATP-binding protein
VLRPDQRAQAGIGWVPQERNIFKSLTVHENLTAVARPGRWSVEKVYGLFPRLAERRQNLGNQLSGGEQQMLAIGRALALNPRVMLLDEPLEGLAPILVEELLAALRRIIRDEGTSAILVEQNAKKILGVTDRAIILERGAVVHAADSAILAADRAALERHLGVTESAPRRRGPA